MRLRAAVLHHDVRFRDLLSAVVSLGVIGQPLFGRLDDARRHLADGDVHRRHLDVDDHRQQRQPDDHVRRRRDEELGMVGHDVAEPDRAQRDDGEVERLEVGPLFPGRVQQRAEQRVREPDGDGDRRWKVELVVDLELDGRVLLLLVVPAGGVPATADGAAERARAPADAAAQPLQQRHADAAGGDDAADVTAAARVVEPTHEHPDELDGARQQPADTGEHDEAERNADQRVDDRDKAASRRHRRHVTVTCSPSAAAHDIVYTVSGKNGTTSILGITLTKFNKFCNFWHHLDI